VAYSRGSKAIFFLDDQRMTSIRVIFSRIATKKVPVLALVVVGLMGMVAGVLAATLTITTTNYSGEIGSLHNTSSGFAVTDNGLAIVANGGGANYINNTQVGASGDQPFNANALVAGHWVDSITFSTTLTDTSSHKVSVTIRSGTSGALGTALLTFGSSSTFIQAPTGSGSGTITLYFDLGSSITTPITVYVNVS